MTSSQLTDKTIARSLMIMKMEQDIKSIGYCVEIERRIVPEIPVINSYSNGIGRFKMNILQICSKTYAAQMIRDFFISVTVHSLNFEDHTFSTVSLIHLGKLGISIFYCKGRFKTDQYR